MEMLKTIRITVFSSSIITKATKMPLLSQVADEIML